MLRPTLVTRGGRLPARRQTPTGIRTGHKSRVFVWPSSVAAGALPLLHRSVHVVLVQVQVKPEQVEAFRIATLANAEATRREPGVVRFDVVQQQDDPTRWVLWEVYRDATAHAAHRDTAHYAAWRKIADPIMASTRVGTKYHGISPAADAW